MVELPPVTVEGDTIRGFLTEDEVAEMIVKMIEITGNEPKELVE